MCLCRTLTTLSQSPSQYGFDMAWRLLLGHPAFNARFGFRPSRNLVLPGAPAECFQELHLDGDKPSDEVTYHAAFNATE